MALTMHTANHGGRPTAKVLSVISNRLPATPRLQPWKELARRKHLTVLNRIGAHELTLRALDRLDPQQLSTYDILRAQALRMTGSLDEAATVADLAYRTAQTEQHPVRVAHAAYQKCQALVWGERLDEAQTCLADELRQHAAIAASRWVAWADFIAAELVVRTDPPDTSSAQLAVDLTRFSERRFLAEALLDGALSARIAQLAALRQLSRLDEFLSILEHAEQLTRSRSRGQRYYAIRHVFTLEALDLERAEFARVHTNDQQTARRLYEQISTSRYPVHAALGHLGAGIIDEADGCSSSHLADAATVADKVGMRLVSSRCREIAAHATGSAREIFFC
jgi:hypothetical protein